MFAGRVEKLYRLARGKLEKDQPIQVVREALVKNAEMDAINTIKEGVRDKELFLFLRYQPNKCTSSNQLMKMIQTWEKGQEAANQRSKHLDSINVLTDSNEEMKVMMNEMKLMLEKSKEEQIRMAELIEKKNDGASNNESNDRNGYFAFAQRQRRGSIGHRGAVTCYKCGK